MEDEVRKEMLYHAGKETAFCYTEERADSHEGCKIAYETKTHGQDAPYCC